MLSGALAKWFDEADIEDTAMVGGKGASLGEMYQKLSGIGVKVPNGFTLTTEAFREFVNAEIPESTWDNVGNPEGIEDVRRRAIACSTLSSALEVCLRDADTSDHLGLNGRASLARSLVRETPVPESVKRAIGAEYSKLCDMYYPGVDVAVRSSATTEDSAEASFAGQYESYLNVSGESEIVEKWRRCVASMFTERSVGYHLENDMHPLDSSIAVVVMKMARSDKACSGVMFTRVALQVGVQGGRPRRAPEGPGLQARRHQGCRRGRLCAARRLRWLPGLQGRDQARRRQVRRLGGGQVRPGARVPRRDREARREEDRDPDVHAGDPLDVLRSRARMRGTIDATPRGSRKRSHLNQPHLHRIARRI